MTVAEGIASILLWSINIGLGCVLIFWCRHQYRIDVLRYRLFVCRDELFDLALAGTLGFRDQAYVLLRRKINNMLRFSHKISLVQAGLVSYFCRGAAFDELRDTDDREWEEAVCALASEEAQNRVRLIRDSVLVEVSRHTVGWFVWKCLVMHSRLSAAEQDRTRAAMREAILKSRTVKTIPVLHEMHPNSESSWMRKPDGQPANLV